MAAALELVGELGANHVSLDAVAERAGVSKGGLLYNFPTKADLLKALVALHLVEADVRRADAEVRLSGARNRTACAHLDAVGLELCKEKAPSGFLAAVAENPDLLAPVRAHNAALVERLRTGDDPVLGLIAFLAVEGLRSGDVFEVNVLTPSERRAVVERLRAMLAC